MDKQGNQENIERGMVNFFEAETINFKISKENGEARFSDVKFESSEIDQFKLFPIFLARDYFKDFFQEDSNKAGFLEEQIQEEEQNNIQNLNFRENNQTHRTIQRRIDKQIRFDLFYYCLLDQCEDKKEIQKRRKQLTEEKHHRSIISTFVLLKLVVLEKNGNFNINALRERVQQRTEKKYEKIAKDYGNLLKYELDLIFSAIRLFLNKKEMEAIERVYQSRQMNSGSITKMNKCKDVIKKIKALRRLK